MHVDRASDIVRVSGVSYEYPGVRALDDVSFTVERGSVTALVGPNGAGKTTLLRCMAALDQPMDGEIEIAGIDVLEHPRECHARIGYLSDFYGVYSTLKVAQCLAHAAAAQGVPDPEVHGAVAEVAERLDLTGKLQEPAKSLSRGQRQRLAIGQALIHKPQLLILDEPASGLDPEARHELAMLFTKLRDHGMTLIVSSHILAELDQYSTHMLVMREGRVIESRALNAISGSAGVRVRIELAEVSLRDTGGATLDQEHEDQLRDAIASLANITLVSAAGQEAIFETSADDGARAALVHALVMAGLPVCGVAVERENLHESYLRTMERADESGAPA